MATGTGKTVVMAMLIAWQTLNKVDDAAATRASPSASCRHAGHHDPRPAAGAASRATTDNYYRERDLVPPDL